MKRLDRFLIKSFIGPFFVTFFLVIFILSLQFLWLYIDELVGKGLGLGVIFEFLGWAACTLIPMALPLATLLASIMTLGGMGEKNELLAMKAAGISLPRILFPLIWVSVLISIGAFFAANNLIPVSYSKIYTLRDDIRKTKEEIKIPTGTFYDGIDGYILRIESRDDRTKMMHNLIIYDHTAHNGNTCVTLADSGRMAISPDKQNLVFHLYDGCSYQETNRMTYRDTTLDLNRLDFKEQELIICLDNYTFTRSDDDRFSDEVMAKGLKALSHDRDSIAQKFDSLRFYQRLRVIRSSSLEFNYQLDSLWLADKMKGNLPLDSTLAGIPADIRLNAMRNAAGNVPTMVDQIENCVREDYHYVDPLRRTDIEWYRKFTLSVACFIFFFIGAPLGAIIRKGGFGTPVIISIFFFLIYYIIDITGKKLAREGSITPFEGTFISTAILLPIGIYLTYRSTKDSSLVNFDSYKLFFKNMGAWFKRIYYKIRNFFRKDFGRIRIVYMGTPEFACGPLDALLKAGFDVAAVVTVPDKPSGRGLKMNESAVKRYAVEHGLPVLQPEKLRDPAFLEQLRSYKANLFVVVAFRMLPREVWSMPRLGTFNLHASLLPQYRGAAPINWALINGERQTGVTTFMIDEQIDTGRILKQQNYLIEDYDNAGSLHDRLMEMGSALVVKTVEEIRDHRTKPQEQDVAHVTLRPAPKLTKEMGRIDWTRSAREINNLIRGLSPYPAAWSVFVNEAGEEIPVKIYEAYVVRDSSLSQPDPSNPGSLSTDGKNWIQVRCGSDALRITELQVAGKKRMDVASFLLGFRDLETYRMA
ncbi:MAG: methionyl-tRNA formyltransferase [Bacteroidales bacterium]|nr:methionyl-tRNA formyltransferase [Bacteroidales bacterium]